MDRGESSGSPGSALPGTYTALTMEKRLAFSATYRSVPYHQPPSSDVGMVTPWNVSSASTANPYGVSPQSGRPASPHLCMVISVSLPSASTAMVTAIRSASTVCTARTCVSSTASHWTDGSSTRAVGHQMLSATSRPREDRATSRPSWLTTGSTPIRATRTLPSFPR